MKTISKAKPFIKWVGGKGQLIEQLDAQLPEDFENWDDVTYIEPFVGGGAMLFYFDPPYRPLSDTSSFNDYAKEAFNDDAQIRLKKYCDRINEAGFRFMLSNSDCKGKNEEDNFFDVLYGEYNRARIYEQNGTPNIVIRNYSKSSKLWHRHSFKLRSYGIRSHLHGSLCNNYPQEKC